jgi:UDP-N-acetylglucosamine 2-epimerase (non-hydrolysing)
MEGMFRAIKRAVYEHPDVKVIYPIHMNPAVRNAARLFEGEGRIRTVEPLDVVDFHNFLAGCYMAVTDSGGIQEEAPHLGKPVILMRNTTERPESIAAGTVMLAGSEENDIYEAVSRLLDDNVAYKAMQGVSDPYGDGLASVRIADILEKSLEQL